MVHSDKFLHAALSSLSMDDVCNSGCTLIMIKHSNYVYLIMLYTELSLIVHDGAILHWFAYR